MKIGVRECFNGHDVERTGCAGCHHAFHVLSPGRVEGGQLIPPRVDGPLECVLCHDALHPVPVTGCTHCEGSFASVLKTAMKASQETRTEVISLRLLQSMIGWKIRIGAWVALLTGRAFGDLFERADGSTQWRNLIVSFALVPALQWAIATQIERRERMLPQLGPHGAIVYGDADTQG